MDWIESWNQAIQYIEEHSTEEIDYREVAHICCCSVYHFQRMFAYMAGISLSEYIRRRKMSLAAIDLQDKSTKIIDVAFKYGYSSPTAFNRAFQSVHSIAPSAMRKEGVSIRFYSPITFKITIKGVEEMNYRMEKKEAFCITGVVKPLCRKLEENMKIVPKMWDSVVKDGTIAKLCSNMEPEKKGILGVSICNDQEEWRYMIAIAGEKTLSGMETYEVPAHTWAVFTGKGVCPQAIQELEKQIYTEWLPSSGYEYDFGPDVEWYLSPDPQKAEFEVWVPVKKK